MLRAIGILIKKLVLVKPYFFNTIWCRWFLSGIKGLPFFINLLKKSLNRSIDGIKKIITISSKKILPWLISNTNAGNKINDIKTIPQLPIKVFFLKFKKINTTDGTNSDVKNISNFNL